MKMIVFERQNPEFYKPNPILTPTVMSNSSSLTMDHRLPIFNPSPIDYTSKSYYVKEIIDTSDFEISDFLVFDEDFLPQSVVSPESMTGGASGEFPSIPRNYSNIISENRVKKRKVNEGSSRVAFRTKSELEIMDDGYKWRKYGKKKVKNNPNPRNYYKCSDGGCNVKKRVERDNADPGYVITSYDGVHNHASPSVVYYNETPLMVPDGWTLQPSSSASLSPPS